MQYPDRWSPIPNSATKYDKFSFTSKHILCLVYLAITGFLTWLHWHQYKKLHRYRKRELYPRKIYKIQITEMGEILALKN